LFSKNCKHKDAFVTPWYDFENSIAIAIRPLYSQPFTHSHLHFPILVVSTASHVSIRLYYISSSTHVAVMTAAIIIIMDVHSTIFESSSPFPHMLHYHDVTTHICQIQVFFDGGKKFLAIKTKSNWGILRGTIAVS